MRPVWLRDLCRELDRLDFYRHALATAVCLFILPVALWATFAPMTTPRNRLVAIRGEVLDARAETCVDYVRRYPWSTPACTEGAAVRYRTAQGAVQTAVFHAPRLAKFDSKQYPTGATIEALMSIEKPSSSSMQYPQAVSVNGETIKSLSGPPLGERLIAFALAIFSVAVVASFAGRMQYRAFEDKLLAR